MLAKEGIFGKHIARYGVTEFQKRGDLLLHITIWIENFDPTLENIYNIICDKIPRDLGASIREDDFSKEDKLAQEYHDKVKRCMMHGPCEIKFGRGHYGCRQDGKCIKNFPKKL